MKRLVLTAFFLEVGFVLIVVPWSAFWDQNYFAQTVPFIGELITNDFVRGAVSGVGVVNIGAGLYELVSLLLARQQEPPPSIPRPPALPDQD